MIVRTYELENDTIEIECRSPEMLCGNRHSKNWCSVTEREVTREGGGVAARNLYLIRR